MSTLQEALKKVRQELAALASNAPAPEPSCAFCGWPKTAVPALLAGPGGAICSDCLEHAYTVVLPGILGNSAPADTAAPVHRPPGRDSFSARTQQTRSLLEQVDGTRGEAVERLGAFVMSLEKFLESAASEKLLLCLPWPEILPVAAALRTLAQTLEAGEQEAVGIAKK
jgi:hypothetical protein